APRVGYAAWLGSNVYMWPRVGFTFVKMTLDAGGLASTGNTAYALTVEVPLVIVVEAHVFVSLAPTLDARLGGPGTRARWGMGVGTSTSMSHDESVTSYGLQAALGAFF